MTDPQRQTDLEKLESKLNLHFDNRNLLLNAFVHRSYLNENKDFFLESNERLEYLGDACLELIVSEYLFKQFPQKPEGTLTNYRSSLVNTKSLAETSRQLELGKLLLLSKGEEENGGKDSEHLLADTFESLLGSCYLEFGMETCRQIIHNFILPKLEKIIHTQSYKDSKSKLQEITQEKLSITPHYRIIGESGPDHNKTFKSAVFVNDRKIGQGQGNSKQKAEIAAAKNALVRISKKL